MRVLMISGEPPFNAKEVVTGNAIRARQLRNAMEAARIEVAHFWLNRDGGSKCFRSADELRGLIQREKPDAILVCYWELLGLLPFDLATPVVLDFLAPRPLEVLFEKPEQTGSVLRRLRIALARCDLVLVGNDQQQSLLSYWLLEAGFDLRAGSPIRIVPTAGNRVQCEKRPTPQKNLRLIGGGVDWPWRQDQDWESALHAAVSDLGEDRISLHLLGGKYRWADSPKAESAGDLLTYEAWSELLGQSHIGLELGDDHIERRHSLSFRSLDYLRHGLPIICSAGQPLAERLERYEAGWVVREPQGLQALLSQVLRHPEEWQRRSENTARLLAHGHDPASCAEPLIHWLRAPVKATRLSGYGLPETNPPQLGVPDLGTRIRRRIRLARRVALHRLLRRGENESAERKHIVMATREDLYPTDHGAAVKIVETARGLSRHDRKVFLVTHDRKHYRSFENGVMSRHRLPRWLGLLSRPEALVKLDHYTRDLPESNAFLYQPLSDGSFFWRTLWVANRHNALCLQAEFPAYAEPCLRAGEVLDLPVLMVEHNVEYERMRAQVPELSADQFATLKALELDLCNRSDGVICVSDNDRQTLAADGVHPGLLHTIPHGIDLESYDDAEPVAVREQFGIPEDATLLVYHGTFAYPPNRDALVQMAREVLPRLEQQGLRAHVLALGHKPPRDLHPQIHCPGTVERMAPWLKAADIAVVPLREGGGTRMKIIDYFAAGLPVVSTSKGIEGIPAADGSEALIRDDWDAFADAIAALAADNTLAETLSTGGRKIARSLDWTQIGGRYLELMRTLSR